MINMYNKDCEEFMAGVPDKHYELVIVDPPYGIGNGVLKNNATRRKLSKAKVYHLYDNSTPPERHYFDELFRISKNQIIWGANHYHGMPSSPAWIVWDKLTGNTDFADCELAYTSFNTAVRKFTFRWSGMLQGDMKNKEIRIHPTQKPVALYKWLLKNYAKPGDKIFDSHGGSGSICIACHDMGFDLDWCEIDQNYYDAAVKRYEQHISQLKLF